MDLHKLEYVHKDIRWENVLFDPFNRTFILSDFDCSESVQDEAKRKERDFSDFVCFKKLKIEKSIEYQKYHDLLLLINLAKDTFRFNVKPDKKLTIFLNHIEPSVKEGKVSAQDFLDGLLKLELP